MSIAATGACQVKRYAYEQLRLLYADDRDSGGSIAFTLKENPKLTVGIRVQDVRAACDAIPIQFRPVLRQLSFIEVARESEH